MFDLMDRFEPERVSISLSSMHASTITPELAREVRRVRKSGFTIAPEAGTQRMRDVINKNLDEEQILNACRLAFEAGWDHIKLYFMIGLPTETDADVDGMVDLAHEILRIARRNGRRLRRDAVTLSASSFIPKAETPFQWLGMDRVENLYRKQDRIAARVRRGVRFKHHACETSFLEGVFSRGDRALGPVLEQAWRNGARFDGWNEHFRIDAWREAFRACAVDAEIYAHRDLDPTARLPWQVVHSRVNRKWLAIELKRALEAATLSVCGPRDCHGCAPFARECVKGVVAETTGRQFSSELPILSTPAAPGPRPAVLADSAPPRVDSGRPAASSAPVEAGPRYRYRARLTKSGRMRYLGHLDLTRLLLRALRRAELPLLYSQGFNPKPRVGFSPALAVGVASEGEYLDFETHSRLEPAAGLSRINAALPDDVRFLVLQEIRGDVPALGQAICAARYRASRRGAGEDLAGVLDAFRRNGPATIERRTKRGALRRFDPSEELLGLEPVDERTLCFTLRVRDDGVSLRPDELLSAIFGESAARVELVREEQLVEWGGRLVDPLLAASAVHAARAVS